MAMPPLKGTRKPPAPGSDHAAVVAWIAGTMPGLQPILADLDARIRAALPGAVYAIKWKRAFYGLPGQGWVIELVAYDVSANLVFPAGNHFEPPPPLGEGSRYIKLRKLWEARDPAVDSWIAQAARHPGWMW